MRAHLCEAATHATTGTVFAAALTAANVVAEGLGAAGELAGGGAGGLAHGAGHRADLVARDLLGRSASALLNDRGLLEAYGSGLVGCSGNLAARFLPCRRGSLRGAAELLFGGGAPGSSLCGALGLGFGGASVFSFGLRSAGRGRLHRSGGGLGCCSGRGSVFLRAQVLQLCLARLRRNHGLVSGRRALARPLLGCDDARLEGLAYQQLVGLAARLAGHGQGAQLRIAGAGQQLAQV